MTLSHLPDADASVDLTAYAHGQVAERAGWLYYRYGEHGGVYARPVNGRETYRRGVGLTTFVRGQHPPEVVRAFDAYVLLDAVAEGFVRAALWADCEPLDYNPEVGERGGCQNLTPTRELRAKAREICARFLAAADDADVAAHMDAYGDPDGGHPGEYIGHTFYLTAAGHGVSFTDRSATLRDGYTPDEAHSLNASLFRLRETAQTFAEVEWLEVYAQADGETAGIY